MSASSSDASKGDDADFELDYAEFFSVLMYYGHMSKKEIMNSSMPFLICIYKQYVKRACENLGVSSNNEDEEESNTQLKESDYPTDFRKLSLPNFSNTDEFLEQFSEYNPNKFNKK